MGTLVEAYAKLRDQNPYPLVNNSSLFHDAGFVPYCIDRHMIMSLSYDSGPFSHAMFWVDQGPGSSDLNNRDLLISHFPRKKPSV